VPSPTESPVIAMTRPAPVRRGVALTSLLVLLTLAQALLHVLTVSRLADDAGHSASVAGAGLLVLLVAVLALVALGAIWAWRRWGVVLFAVVAVVGLVTDLAGGVGALLLVRVLLLGVFFWAISARWERFE
jgi:hypothetical protein